MAKNEKEREALNAIVGITEMDQERNYTSMAKFFDDLFTAYSSKLNQAIEPDTIESTYAGVHLNDVYEEGDFMNMVEGFNQGKMIHAKYALQILRDAIAKFERMPNVSVVDFNKSKTQLPSCIIVGDLHGSFKDLNYIINKFGVPGKKHRFVFNVSK